LHLLPLFDSLRNRSAGRSDALAGISAEDRRGIILSAKFAGLQLLKETTKRV
jgi:hypothetical protein